MIWKLDHALPAYRVDGFGTRTSKRCAVGQYRTGFGVAKLRPPQGRCRSDTMALRLTWLLDVAFTSLPGFSWKTNCDSPRYSAASRYIQHIIAHPGLLSVTERALRSRLNQSRGHMSKFPARDARTQAMHKAMVLRNAAEFQQAFRRQARRMGRITEAWSVGDELEVPLLSLRGSYGPRGACPR
jgi:hypothetical protein